jgi:hypothetical protein
MDRQKIILKSGDIDFCLRYLDYFMEYSIIIIIYIYYLY